MKALAGFAVLTLAATALHPAAAAEACSAYMMDVENELLLFNESPAPIEAGREAGSAQVIRPGVLYAVKLASQKQVRFVAPPGRRPIEPEKVGGLLRLRIEKSGSYRISTDANFWIDVVRDGAPLAATDFRSDRDCPGPRKIVTFNLAAGAELLVQLADVDVDRIRLTVTETPPPVW